ncbi:MAG: Methyltransferase FkbM family [Hyphomicrobiales bacterium]|nr:Methyltransferase FkbM family [Hyphomicrobiales bacterium]
MFLKNVLPRFVRPFARRQYLKAHLTLRGQIPYAGQKVFCPSGSIIFDRISRTGTYEPEIVDVLVALAKPNTTLFDVGANIGVLSSAVLARRSDIRIVAFECSPATLPYLRRTHESSTHKDRWEIMEVAAADQDGVLDFYTFGAEQGAYDGLSSTGRGGTSIKVSVTARRLDAVWEDLKRPEVSLLKIDIEGGESAAMKGAAALIEVCRPYIVFEWNTINLCAYGVAADQIFSLVPSGYELYSLPFLTEVKRSLLTLELSRTEMFLLAPQSLGRGEEE